MPWVSVTGFARIILAIISFYYMPTHCVVAVTCYVTSALLDAFDGHAARYYNQSKPNCKGHNPNPITSIDIGLTGVQTPIQIPRRSRIHIINY